MFGQSHFFTQSRFSALGGVNGELGRGDSSRGHSKYSPPWVCEKCAKKHPSELGCREAAERGLVIQPNDVEFDYVETTRDIDQVLGHTHRTYEEQLGCDKCKRGKRRRKAAEEAAERAAAAQAASAFYVPYNLRGGFRVMNQLGHLHRDVMGQQTQALNCPASPPDTSDPTLNCMRDARGNAVCSNGLFYPPGCPHTPPDQFFTPGISPDEVVGGILQAKIPPPRAAGTAGSAGAPSASNVSTTTVVAAGAGVLGIGALLFLVFK